MKTIALAIATSAALALTGVATAGAATPASATRLMQPGVPADAAADALKQVRHGGPHRGARRGLRQRGARRGLRQRGVRRGLRHRGFRRGFRRSPRLHFYFHTPVYYNRCRRFYYLGFVRGIPRYRHLYFRLCRGYRYY